MTKMRLAAPLRYAARRKGTGGIVCPWVTLAATRLRFTHGYALAAAYAASLHPRLCSFAATRLPLLNI
ncbi:MAG: hypothetical protein IKP00_17335 [Victivallales bacterium]|nr:hypothetical protein [Victivallales bacterium]